MSRKRIYVAVAAVALVVLAGASYAVAQGTGQTPDNGPGNPGREERAHAELNGYQEVPSVSTTGFGEFTAIVDDETQTITYTLTYAAVQGVATAAHIHLGQRSVNGGVSAFLCGGGDKPPCPLVAGTVTDVITPAEVVGPALQGIEPGSMPELIRAIRAGATYVNVHSTRFPNGEIRAQIADQNQRQPH